MWSERTTRTAFLHNFLFLCVVCLINLLASSYASAQTTDSQPGQAQLSPQGDAVLDQYPSSSVSNQSATFSPTTNNDTFQSVSQTQPLPQEHDGKNLSDATLFNQTNFNTSANVTGNELNILAVSGDPSSIPLDTKITVPLSILGALLMASGGPMCLWGGRNRWSSYFLTGAYVAAMLVMVPILRFGVIEQEHSPSGVVQGIFVLVCLISAIGAGAIGVIFWKGTRFIVGAGGGFAISLFILSLRSSATIRPVGLRYILILGCVVVGFVSATVPALSLHVTLFSTAAMGAAAVVLGIDCFTTGGLKEFWLYILGFGGLFPRLTSFPFTVTIQAELGVMVALFMMGAAVQWRLLEVIIRKINELKQLDHDRNMQEEAAAYRQSMLVDADLADWEKRHEEEDERKTKTNSGIPASSMKDYHDEAPLNRVSQINNSQIHESTTTPRPRFSYELVPCPTDPFAHSPPQPSPRPQSHMSSIARSSFHGLPRIESGAGLDV